MSPRFSIVIPTRHRPAFVREALRFAKLQQGDFEVVLSDNWVDPKLSAKDAFDEAALNNAVYVRPPEPLGMVGNWNFALSSARGQYVMFLTDKTFLLPDVLQRLAPIVDAERPDIVNWTSDAWVPIYEARPFAAGFYGRAASRWDSASEHRSFDPLEALSFKGRALIPRASMAARDYVRGKICFGAFSRDLLDRMRLRFGEVFKPLSPDYTSMILGLSEARSAIELQRSASVQIATHLSTGYLGSIDDRNARRYLLEIGVLEQVLQGGIAPGLFASVAGNVAYDYVELKRRFDLKFEFDVVNWLRHSSDDLALPGRAWSSDEVRQSQVKALQRAVASLAPADASRFKAGDRQRTAEAILHVPPSLVQRARARLKDWLARGGGGGLLALAAHHGWVKDCYAPSLQSAVRDYSRGSV